MTTFVRLQDLVLPPPFPAVLAVCMVAGLAYLGWRIALGLRAPSEKSAVERVDVAAGFVFAAAGLAVAVHTLAWAQLATATILRPVGWALATLGGFAVARHCRRLCSVLVREAEALCSVSRIERCGAILVALTLSGLAMASLGPPTDADSLDYHLGVPLDWLGHGGAHPTPEWFHARLIGLGETLNMLGLAAGSDCMGAVLQLGGLLVAVLAVRQFASTPRDRLLAWLLVVACPAVACLVPAQKPQMLPAAATTVAAVLAIRRYSRFRSADAVLAFGCLAFAAASKISFFLSVGFVALLCFAAARHSRTLRTTVGIATVTFALIVGPGLARNFAYYGDPLSPFLERFRSHPNLVVVAFGNFLRVVGGAPNARSLALLPLRILGTVHPGLITTVLGVGALAVLLTARASGGFRWLLLAAAGAALAEVALGQLAPRFFLEPYLWVGIALMAVPWTRGKTLLLQALTLQAVLTAAVALFGAATLFPGALTAAQRERVMLRAAAGYAEARWLDRVLPANAVLSGPERFHALTPRRFLVADPVTWDPARRNDPRALARLLLSAGVNSVVVTSRDSVFRGLAHACGERLGLPGRVPLATRNPLNLTTYEIEVYRLKDCERLLAAPLGSGRQ